MAFEVILPKLDEAMTCGRITRWHKQAGDEVGKGDVIVELETEKVNFEVEADAGGVLSELLAEEGDEVTVGAAIVYILKPGEQMPETVSSAGVPGVEPRAKEAQPVGGEAAAGGAPQEPAVSDIRASPLARKIARENGLDISIIEGSGPGGRIEKADVELALSDRSLLEGVPAAAGAAAAPGEEVEPLSSVRKVIAERMTHSFQAPHFYLAVDVDAGRLTEARACLLPLVQERTGLRLTLSDLLIKIAAKALDDNPRVNSAYVDGGSVRLFTDVAIGLVTSVEGGLMVPVIRQANTKSLFEIARARDDLVRRARERKLNMDEMRGSTFTVSNMGMYEVDEFSAILQPPEAAILAVGRIEERAVVKRGEIVARPMMTLTLSIDHRVLDGALGAAFLSSVKRYIESPFDLLS